jgi:hypothetical protein
MVRITCPVGGRAAATIVRHAVSGHRARRGSLCGFVNAHRERDEADRVAKTAELVLAEVTKAKPDKGFCR